MLSNPRVVIVFLMSENWEIYADWNPWHGCTKISPGCKYCYVYHHLNLLGFVLSCFGEALHSVNAAAATALPLVYLPLGILLVVWYRGRLGKVGLWMVIRILVVNLIPVLFYGAGLLDNEWGLIVMEVITISVDIWYAWVLRRVLGAFCVSAI